MENFDAGMNFVSGGDKKFFTKTPANVSYDHLEKPVPIRGSRVKAGTKNTSSGRLGTKRKVAAAPDDDSACGAEKKKSKKSGVIGDVKSGISKATAAALARPKQKRKSKGKKNVQTRAIPRSYDECDEADRLLIQLRDAGGEWKDIRPKWSALTREKTAPSTLPNRYARMKSNFTVIDEEDNQRLLDAKRDVEDTFEQQKWDLIANMVHTSGGQEYMGLVLKRQYKKLMTSVGITPPDGMIDPDFSIHELESDDERIGKEEDGDEIDEEADPDAAAGDEDDYDEEE